MKLGVILVFFLFKMTTAVEEFVDEEVPDCYKELEIERNTSLKGIKNAFRKLAISFHPDKNKDKGAEEKFKRLNEAQEVLLDEDLRKVYDAELEQYEEWIEAAIKQNEFITEDDKLSNNHEADEIFEHRVTENKYSEGEEKIFTKRITVSSPKLEELASEPVHTSFKFEEDYGSEFLQEWLDIGAGHISSRHLGEL